MRLFVGSFITLVELFCMLPAGSGFDSEAQPHSHQDRVTVWEDRDMYVASLQPHTNFLLNVALRLLCLFHSWQSEEHAG